MGILPIGIVNVVLVFFMVELFDATGTLMGVANRAGLLKNGKMERLNRALLTGRARGVKIIVWIIAAVFLSKLIYLGS